MSSYDNEEQRKIFGSIAGQEMPTFQMTCSEAIIPRGVGKARGRLVEYGETEATFDIFEIHNCNCILPYEKFEASFDQELGKFYPLGARGLFRRVKAKESGGVCQNVPCWIETEGEGFSDEPGEQSCRVKVYETLISVWATEPIDKDQIFWVTYQPDRDKPLVPVGQQSEVAAAAGRWIPISEPVTDHARIDVAYNSNQGTGGANTVFDQGSKENSETQRIPLFVKDCYPHTQSSFINPDPYDIGSAISDVFANQPPPDSLDSPGRNTATNNLRLILRKPGTYSGIIVLQWSALLAGELVDWLLTQETGPSPKFVKVDRSDGLGTENVLVQNSQSIASYLLDYILVFFNLVPTTLGNNSGFVNTSESVSHYRFGISLPKTLTAINNQRGEITLPFIFSVDKTSFPNRVFTPFELQLWGADLRGSGEANAYTGNSNLTIRYTDTGGGAEKSSSWIKYSPNIMAKVYRIQGDQGEQPVEGGPVQEGGQDLTEGGIGISEGAIVPPDGGEPPEEPPETP